MTSPSLCFFNTEEEYKFENCTFFNVNGLPKTYGRHLGHVNVAPLPLFETDLDRYYSLTFWAIHHITKQKTEKVYIEDYSMGSKGRVFGIAENTGLLKHFIWRYNIPIVPIAPTKIKKDFTGKGGAKKAQMEEEFKKRTCLDLRKVLNLTDKQENPISDIIDSFALGEIAYNESKA